MSNTNTCKVQPIGHFRAMLHFMKTKNCVLVEENSTGCRSSAKWSSLLQACRRRKSVRFSGNLWFRKQSNFWKGISKVGEFFPFQYHVHPGGTDFEWILGVQLFLFDTCSPPYFNWQTDGQSVVEDHRVRGDRRRRLCNEITPWFTRERERGSLGPLKGVWIPGFSNSGCQALAVAKWRLIFHCSRIQNS